MPDNDRDKLNRIEELKAKLFSKNYKARLAHRDVLSDLHAKNVPDSWDRPEEDPNSKPKFFMKTPIFKSFFIFSLVFFVVAMSYAAYVFFAGQNTVSNDNIDISILGNNFVAGGDELSLIVGITNKNSSPLDLVDLVMEYPKGSSENSGSKSSGSTAGQTADSTALERSRISLGTIPAGAIHNENVKLVLFGEQGSSKQIKFSIEYRVEGSNAIFVKEKLFSVTINSTPINLSVEAPSVISPNQDLTLEVKVSLNSTRPASDILLKVNYPVGFKFKSAKPEPAFGNNVWNLGDIAPGGEHNISITGKMQDVFDGEEKVFQIVSGSQSAADKTMIGTIFNSISQNISIKKPFIEAVLSINGVHQREYASSSKTPITADIQWTNNLDTKVNDLEIRAKISGNAVDRKTISADQGFYNSSTDVITWDKNSKGELAEVNPGDSGSVRFSISPTSLYSATGGLLPNPSINIEVSISGKQLVENYAPKNLDNLESSTIHIISDVGVTSKALYYSGPFTNKGAIPPKAEHETTYTVQWSVSNTANTLSRGVMRSSLPSWVRFVGTISPVNEDLIYNPSTKEITWNIGGVPKGAGLSNDGRSVSFQVALTPSLSQVATSPIIINASALTAHDDFANVDVSINKPSLTTNLNSDSAFPVGGALVVE